MSETASYAVRHYDSASLPPEIAGQIVGLYQVMFNLGATGENRFEDPFAHSERFDHFVIFERGLLISHADVSQRTISHAGESYRVGCVGEVMTQPNFRHEGHGQRTVAAATELILNSGVDVGMLFTDPDLSAFYGANGWIALDNPGITFGNPAQPDFDDAFVMMLFLSERARAHRDDFEHGPIYVGQLLW